MAVFESSHIAEYSNYINNTNAKLSPGTSGLNPGSFQVICEQLSATKYRLQSVLIVLHPLDRGEQSSVLEENYQGN